MALFKCKMCGGDLEIAQGTTVAECEYCGTQQTLPKLDDDKRANMYARANHFRRNNDFDKAMGIYEQILNEDNTDAEAYWSLVLCRFGIEYVEDPSTHKRVPTINRAQFTSVFDDDNYKSALQYADSYQRTIYEAEANTINEIQKGILAISQKEEPFDVFICYKETDENGRRTQDSVLAQDLYYQLTQEGFKVFFARITLEDKLGSAYEPYIFAALNSAKVMVALGTKPEYFKAVWVRNEWSRYLALIKQGQKKMLIPAYKDMDPYDLPDEFSHLQAQDMSKLGFMQDLVRGITKIAQADEPKQTTVVKETVVTANANTAPLLKRAFMFLEDGDWNSANEYCEKVLDIDPECAQAYLGKLMAELKVKTKENLKNQAYPFDRVNNYQKAIRFGDDALRTELEEYIEHINTRNENARLLGIYNNAKEKMNSAKSEGDYKSAAIKFETITQYQDSASLAQECRKKAEVARKDEIYNDAKEQLKEDTTKSCNQAYGLFKSIPGWRDSDSMAVKCKERIDYLYIKNKYDTAKGGYFSVIKNIANLDLEAKLSKLAEVQKEFEKLGEFEDSQEMVLKCIKEIERIQDVIEEDKRRKEAEAIAEAKRVKKNKIIAAITIPLVIAAIAFLIVWTNVIVPNSNYNNAMALLDAGKYDEAISAFEALDGYKDSDDMVLESQYRQAIALMEDGQYNNARIILSKLGDFGTSKGKIEIIKSITSIKNGKYNDAIKAILSASETVSVKYNLDGGTSSIGDYFTYSKSSDYSSLLTPQKEGYSFVKWELLEYSYSRDNSLEFVLKAIWSDGYSIRYNLDGGTALNPAEYHKEGEAVTLTNPEKEGYTFIGWTGTDLSDLSMNVTIPAGSYGDREFTANWKPNKYTITLKANGGSVSSSSISVNYDALYSLPTPTRNYYTFAGWYEGTTKYEGGTWSKVSDATLTAKWTPVSYTITYNLNGGTNSSQNAKSFTVESSKISLKDPTKTGYKFLGWYKDSSYSNKVTEIAAGSHSNISLYAKWEIVTYTITYNLNGGSISGTKKTTFTVNDLPLTLATPTRNDCVFLGWKKDNYNGKDISKITDCENITVYATYMDVYLQLTLYKPTYSWDGTETYYKVTKYSGSATTVDIPSYYEGYPVREISSSAFSNNKTVTTVNIPSTITEIDYYAFKGCTSLKKITIPDSVTSIGSEAFSGCTSLTSISLPSAMKTINDSTFERCSALTSITIPNSVTSIGESAFEDCTSLKTVQLPNKLTTMSNYAFRDCSSLTSIEIPGTLKEIDYCTFAGCSNLTTVILNEGLEEINFGAFGSPKLTKLIIPKSVKYIDYRAFDYSSYGACSNINFYCRASSMPGGWESGWNNSRPVVWGYTGN